VWLASSVDARGVLQPRAPTAAPRWLRRPERIPAELLPRLIELRGPDMAVGSVRYSAGSGAAGSGAIRGSRRRRTRSAISCAGSDGDSSAGSRSSPAGGSGSSTSDEGTGSSWLRLALAMICAANPPLSRRHCADRSRHAVPVRAGAARRGLGSRRPRATATTAAWTSWPASCGARRAQCAETFGVSGSGRTGRARMVQGGVPEPRSGWRNGVGSHHHEHPHNRDPGSRHRSCPRRNPVRYLIPLRR
jgi:hypothetical protein